MLLSCIIIISNNSARKEEEYLSLLSFYNNYCENVCVLALVLKTAFKCAGYVITDMNSTVIRSIPYMMCRQVFQSNSRRGQKALRHIGTVLKIFHFRFF